ncbi:hypothetical protein C8R43DRAFT_1105158 [Mycena crocata]|nr:hypothetical protein C8R43DRAFT_1105158 [Mycena crocata]
MTFLPTTMIPLLLTSPSLRWLFRSSSLRDATSQRNKSPIMQRSATARCRFLTRISKKRRDPQTNWALVSSRTHTRAQDHQTTTDFVLTPAHVAPSLLRPPVHPDSRAASSHLWPCRVPRSAGAFAARRAAACVESRAQVAADALAHSPSYPGPTVSHIAGTARVHDIDQPSHRPAVASREQITGVACRIQRRRRVRRARCVGGEYVPRSHQSECRVERITAAAGSVAATRIELSVSSGRTPGESSTQTCAAQVRIRRPVKRDNGIEWDVGFVATWDCLRRSGLVPSASARRSGSNSKPTRSRHSVPRLRVRLRIAPETERERERSSSKLERNELELSTNQKMSAKIETSVQAECRNEYNTLHAAIVRTESYCKDWDTRSSQGSKDKIDSSSIFRASNIEIGAIEAPRGPN